MTLPLQIAKSMGQAYMRITRNGAAVARNNSGSCNCGAWAQPLSSTKVASGRPAASSQDITGGLEGRWIDRDEARAWAGGFVHWNNGEHLQGGTQNVRPGQRHEGKGQKILAARYALYA